MPSAPSLPYLGQGGTVVPFSETGLRRSSMTVGSCPLPNLPPCSCPGGRCSGSRAPTGFVPGAQTAPGGASQEIPTGLGNWPRIHWCQGPPQSRAGGGHAQERSPKHRKWCVRRDGSGSWVPLELRSPNSVPGVAGFQHKPACRAAPEAKSQLFASRSSPPCSKSPGWRPPQGLFSPQAKEGVPAWERKTPATQFTPQAPGGLRAQRRLGPGGQGELPHRPRGH